MAFVAIGFGESLIGALGVDVVLVESLPRCLPIRVSKHCVMAISKLQLRIATYFEFGATNLSAPCTFSRPF